MSVPLCFAASDEYNITAPEKITVTLKGRRADLYTLDTTTLAAHINAEKLSCGKHGIILKENHLFLPYSIALAQYTPSNIVITVTKK